MEYSTLLANRILELIEKQNITVNRLADLSEITISVVDNIVKGKIVNPSIVTIHSLALGLGMTVSELLDFDEMNQVTFRDIRRFRKQQDNKKT